MDWLGSLTHDLLHTNKKIAINPVHSKFHCDFSKSLESLQSQSLEYQFTANFIVSHFIVSSRMPSSACSSRVPSSEPILSSAGTHPGLQGPNFAQLIIFFFGGGGGGGGAYVRGHIGRAWVLRQGHKGPSSMASWMAGSSMASWSAGTPLASWTVGTSPMSQSGTSLQATHPPRRWNCYGDCYVRLLVLFCPVVLPGFLYLVIFLSLFSLIIILITWSLPIYSVPCLVQVFIALPFPCFFVLSHVVLSVFFFAWFALVDLLKDSVCLISASFVFLTQTNRDTYWIIFLLDSVIIVYLNIWNYSFTGLWDPSFTGLSGKTVYRNNCNYVYIFGLQSYWNHILSSITVLLDSLEPQFYWTLWNHSFTGLPEIAVLLDSLEPQFYWTLWKPQFYWTLLNRKFTGLSGTAVLLESLEPQFYWTLWNHSFTGLPGIAVLWTLWNHSFTGLSGITVLLDSLESQFYWTLWNYSFIWISGTAVLLDYLQ